MRALLLAIVLAGCGGAPEIQPPPPSTDSSPQLAHASVSGTVRLNGRWWPDGTSRQLASLDPIEGFDPRRAETLTLGPAGTMADVYITVTSGLDDREFPIPDAPAVVRLDGLVFAPRVIGLLVNQEIEYRNADRVMHGPHSQSRLSPAFGKGSAEAVTREVFVRSESAIPVACDVHPWM